MQTTLRPGKINIGGDHYFGDIRRRIPKSKRIFFQNLGGFPTDTTKMRTSLDEIKTFGAHFIGLQETKLNHTHREMIRRVQGNVFNILRANSVFRSNSDGYI